MSLSVAMVVKNEERLIRRALRTVCEADEIVIVDTGSTDNTEKIVTTLGWPNVRFIKGQYVWKDDFADARNFAMSLCTHDWVLFLDADDRMVEDSIYEIKELIKGQPDANSFKVKVTYEKFAGHYFYPKILRKSSGIQFVGAAHEAPNLSGSDLFAGEMILGRSENHDRDKERALRILYKMHQEDPEDARTLYYLAREFMYHEDFEKSKVLFERCVELSQFRAERADACLYLARIYWQQSNGSEARYWCMNAITINANFREALCFMAELSFQNNARRWKEFAKLADNTDVLFVRPCSCS